MKIKANFCQDRRQRTGCLGQLRLRRRIVQLGRLEWGLLVLAAVQRIFRKVVHMYGLLDLQQNFTFLKRCGMHENAIQLHDALYISRMKLCVVTPGRT